ncbi:MAG: TIGR00266 family protein [Planctomycetota bacterium]|nr:TIGR00266 family protein [Planctomycetota bacterium]
MNTQLDYSIDGDDFQYVQVRLGRGDAVRAEPGAFVWMETGIEMETTTGGGVLSGLKRMIGGESFFVTTFTNQGSAPATVAFAAPYPGKVLPIDLSRGTVLCQRDAYLCSTTDAQISVAFTRRFGAGLFGGEGFILQRIEGRGTAFLHASGSVVERTLGQGETLRVDTGCIVAMESEVDYDIQMVRGVKSFLFGGEGLFFAALRGPGRVWLQTLPFSRLAGRLMAAAGGRKEQGGLLGNLLQGDN